jgi:hypothetical protein
MNDWNPLDQRIAGADRPSQDRLHLVNMIKTSRLRLKPGTPVNQYMAYLLAPDGETICLEHNHLRPNLWFGARHGAALAGAGLALDRKVPGSGRHSGLNTDAGLSGQEAFGLRSPPVDMARRALDLLELLGEMQLDPAVLDRWIAKLQAHFPGFDGFDPDRGFDARETDYKLAVTMKLTDNLAAAVTPDDRVRAVYEAFQNYNLLN